MSQPCVTLLRNSLILSQVLYIFINEVLASYIHFINIIRPFLNNTVTVHTTQYDMLTTTANTRRRVNTEVYFIMMTQPSLR